MWLYTFLWYFTQLVRILDKHYTEKKIPANTIKMCWNNASLSTLYAPLFSMSNHESWLHTVQFLLRFISRTFLFSLMLLLYFLLLYLSPSIYFAQYDTQSKCNIFDFCWNNTYTTIYFVMFSARRRLSYWKIGGPVSLFFHYVRYYICLNVQRKRIELARIRGHCFYSRLWFVAYSTHSVSWNLRFISITIKSNIFCVLFYIGLL